MNPDTLTSLLAGQRWTEALALLDAALRDTPERCDLLLCRTYVLQQLGRTGEVLVEWAAIIVRWPERIDLRIAYAKALAGAGQFEAARVELECALARMPNSVDSWQLLGQCLHALGHHLEALQALERADALLPNQPGVAHGLGEVLLALERPEAALHHYRQLRSLLTGASPTLDLRIAQCLRRAGDHGAALTALVTACAESPDFAPLQLERGGLHEDLGDREAALLAYAQAHRLAPYWSAPVSCAIGAAPLTASPSLVSVAEAMLMAEQVPDEDRAILHHMLGKRADLRGEHADAANHWLLANRLRRARDGRFDRAAFVGQIDQLIATYTTELLAELQAQAMSSARPVLIVGCPRSGSTLVERILAAHPATHARGESNALPTLVREFGEQSPQRLRQLDAEALAGRYLAQLSSQHDTSAHSRLIDKQPWNLLHLGLFAAIFSSARVIWCRRDPRDVALSIYSESFSPRWTYATDLDDIRVVIAECDRLMQHWQRVLPAPALELHYEQLVSAPEAGMRNLIAFAGLEWSERCLKFHRSSQPVQTLSRWQVREPPHTRSIGRWRNYVDWFPGQVTS
jgi:tetratricopeptide (TPR) repeat protein